MPPQHSVDSGAFPNRSFFMWVAVRSGCQTGSPLRSLPSAARIVDVRSLDGEPLLTSPHVEDNVIAVLTRFGNEREAVRRILIGIAGCGQRRRSAALSQLILLAGLRDMGTLIREEVKQMPILDDIMDHPVLGRERKRGIAIGLERERQLVLRMIGKRFGPVPASARKRIEALPAPKLERVALQLLDARSLDELLA